MAKIRVWLFCMIAVGLIGLWAAASDDTHQPTASAPVVTPTGKAEEIHVPPPPFSEDIFPCMDCHEDMDADPERRDLDFHEEIVLQHDEENRWCLDCHDQNNRDVLRLASGKHVSFEESYKLCGQCHGPKLRDWKAGVHGRRIGDWNGEKTYLLCAHCHNPHSPAFKPIKPLPAPVRPDQMRANYKNKTYFSPELNIDTYLREETE